MPNPDYRPVVVAVDRSDSSRDAAAWAADIAADWSVPLHLLHVVDGDPQDPPLPVPAWLAALGVAAERDGARPTTIEVLPGDVVTTAAARAFGARMLVLGSYGKDAPAGTLAGSVALGVVGRVACPVAVVRGSAPRLAPPRGGPVVVGVDDSVAGEAALSVAADLAVSLGARLVAVHAWSDVTADVGGHLRRSSESVASLAAEAPRFLDARLETVRERHPGLETERRVVDDTPLRTLIDAAPGARVLVVGTRGRAGGDRVRMGSTSNALLEFAPCPVVVVHGHRPFTAATPAARPGIEARS